MNLKWLQTMLLSIKLETKREPLLQTHGERPGIVVQETEAGQTYIGESSGAAIPSL